MANAAAYTGLRWGELTALTIGQVDPDARVIAVDRKVIEVAGHLYLEAQKNRKRRQTIYPACPRPATRWPTGSPPASSRPAPDSTPRQPGRADLPQPGRQAPSRAKEST
jgi:hypothetical protein